MSTFTYLNEKQGQRGQYNETDTSMTPSLSSLSASTHLEDIKPKLEVDSSDLRGQAAQAAKDVQAKMDEAARRVVQTADKIQNVAKPYAKKMSSFSEEYPVLFTFLVIFTALSTIPVLCFVGFVLTAAGLIVGTACVVICLSIFGAILLGATFLLPVLMFTTFLSVASLSFLIFLFLSHRLYIHLTTALSTSETNTQNGLDIPTLSKGVKSWLNETKDRLPSLPIGKNGNGIHWNPSKNAWDLGSNNATDREETIKELKRGLSSVGLGIKSEPLEHKSFEYEFDEKSGLAFESDDETIGKAAGRDGGFFKLAEIEPVLHGGENKTTKGRDVIGVNWSPPEIIG